MRNCQECVLKKLLTYLFIVFVILLVWLSARHKHIHNLLNMHTVRDPKSGPIDTQLMQDLFFLFIYVLFIHFFQRHIYCTALQTVIKRQISPDTLSIQCICTFLEDFKGLYSGWNQAASCLCMAGKMKDPHFPHLPGYKMTEGKCLYIENKRNDRMQCVTWMTRKMA